MQPLPLFVDIKEDTFTCVDVDDVIGSEGFRRRPVPSYYSPMRLDANNEHVFVVDVDLHAVLCYHIKQDSNSDGRYSVKHVFEHIDGEEEVVNFFVRGAWLNIVSRNRLRIYQWTNPSTPPLDCSFPDLNTTNRSFPPVVAVSIDGRSLFTTSLTQQCTVFEFNLPDAKQCDSDVQPLSLHRTLDHPIPKRHVTCCITSPCGRFLFVAYKYGTFEFVLTDTSEMDAYKQREAGAFVARWDLQSGTVTEMYRSRYGIQMPFTELYCAPDMCTLAAACSYDQDAVLFWDLLTPSTGEPQLNVWDVSAEPNNCLDQTQARLVDFTSDGRHVVLMSSRENDPISVRHASKPVDWAVELCIPRPGRDATIHRFVVVAARQHRTDPRQDDDEEGKVDEEKTKYQKKPTTTSGRVDAFVKDDHDIIVVYSDGSIARIALSTQTLTQSSLGTVRDFAVCELDSSAAAPSLSSSSSSPLSSSSTTMVVLCVSLTCGTLCFYECTDDVAYSFRFLQSESVHHLQTVTIAATSNVFVSADQYKVCLWALASTSDKVGVGVVQVAQFEIPRWDYWSHVQVKSCFGTGAYVGISFKYEIVPTQQDDGELESLTSFYFADVHTGFYYWRRPINGNSSTTATTDTSPSPKAIHLPSGHDFDHTARIIVPGWNRHLQCNDVVSVVRLRGRSVVLLIDLDTGHAKTKFSTARDLYVLDHPTPSSPILEDEEKRKMVSVYAIDNLFTIDLGSDEPVDDRFQPLSDWRQIRDVFPVPQSKPPSFLVAFSNRWEQFDLLSDTLVARVEKEVAPGEYRTMRKVKPSHNGKYILHNDEQGGNKIKAVPLYPPRCFPLCRRQKNVEDALLSFLPVKDLWSIVFDYLRVDSHVGDKLTVHDSGKHKQVNVTSVHHTLTTTGGSAATTTTVAVKQLD